MYKTFLVVFAFWFCCTKSTAQVSIAEIVKDISIQPDQHYLGAKGILISGTYSFASKDSFQYNPIDSRFFLVAEADLENNKPVPLHFAFANEIKKKARREYMDGIENGFTTDVVPEMIRRNRDSVYTLELFIPYAAFNLPAGEHKIQVQYRFDGDDAYRNRHCRMFAREALTIHIPVQRKFWIQANTIEVSTLNENGQAWDYSFFGKDAPDLKLSLSVGGLTIAASGLVKNSYSFPGGFAVEVSVCEGDELRLLLADVDLSVDDIIADWKIETRAVVINQSYSFTNNTGQVKSCSIQYKLQ